MKLLESPFYFLRHGETDWNLSQRAQGQTDVPLNAAGRTQAQAMRAIVQDIGVKTICTSPLVRAFETANILNETIQGEIQIVDNLKECCWGVGEGQIKGRWYDKWRRGGDLAGAEPYSAFIERALNGINQALVAPGPVLIVAHGGIYWAIQHYADLVIDGDLPNCVPVRHDPPDRLSPRWVARALRD